MCLTCTEERLGLWSITVDAIVSVLRDKNNHMIWMNMLLDQASETMNKQANKKCGALSTLFASQSNKLVTWFCDWIPYRLLYCDSNIANGYDPLDLMYVYVISLSHRR